MFFPLRDDNPTRTVSWLTYVIIVTNVVVFVVGWFSGPVTFGAVHQSFGLVPARILADPLGDGLTLLSSMFLHGGWYHLASNMWFLHVFGDNLEDTLGKGAYVRFYVLCGLGAAAAQVLSDVHSAIPMVGASGAIAGVVGGYLVLYPRAPILAFNTIPLLWLFMGVTVIVPAWVIALIFFVTNLSSAYLTLGNTASAGVAFFAHLGGFIVGVLLAKLMAPKLPRRPTMVVSHSRISRAPRPSVFRR